eukprot:TRINITY_DN9966_c0_g2_i1.p1 TRINITY_DN9966_c0_g2~~TRINITY_DN9966_c0_g2_i1.p1  ORF type:complete len:158 (+),score=19.35 TRINITY_DN9966_c0_g2_i1:96-569(+)
MEELRNLTCDRLYGANGLIKKGSLGQSRSAFDKLPPLSLRDCLHEESDHAAVPAVLPEIGHAVRCIVQDNRGSEGFACGIIGVIMLNGALAPVAEPAASWKAVLTGDGRRPAMLDIGRVFRAAIANIDPTHQTIILTLKNELLHPSYVMTLTQPHLG